MGVFGPLGGRHIGSLFQQAQIADHRCERGLDVVGQIDNQVIFPLFTLLGLPAAALQSPFDLLQLFLDEIQLPGQIGPRPAFFLQKLVQLAVHHLKIPAEPAGELPKQNEKNNPAHKQKPFGFVLPENYRINLNGFVPAHPRKSLDRRHDKL